MTMLYTYEYFCSQSQNKSAKAKQSQERVENVEHGIRDFESSQVGWVLIIGDSGSVILFY